MKTSKLFFVGLLSLGVVFTSCSDDDEPQQPEGTCETPTDLIVQNATATSVTLDWISAGSAWTVEYGMAGFDIGTGTQVEVEAKPVTIDGLSAFTDYDFYVRNNCSSGGSNFSTIANFSTPSPLIGSWVAYDVSPLLAGVGITGITADFNANNTYVVTSIADGAQTILEGTYSITSDANSEGIYAITLNQSSPSSLTSEGIFKVFAASPDSMWYEVAQTDPAITGVTPPTQSGGFGSTSGGAFGNMNIQKYTRQ